MRTIALGRKNYLFVGSPAGGRAAAVAYTLIETAKLNGVDPQTWLADTIAGIPDYKITRVSDLLPWNQRSRRTLTHRRVIARVLTLSEDLERRLPHPQKAEPAPKQETRIANRPVAPEGALQAARQAISELGRDADRQVLLARADAIWKRQSCVSN